jgi:hypothetical protein
MSREATLTNYVRSEIEKMSSEISYIITDDNLAH